ENEKTFVAHIFWEQPAEAKKEQSFVESRAYAQRGWIHQLLGDVAAADRDLNHAFSLPDVPQSSKSYRARVVLARGERSKAIAQLEDCVRQHYGEYQTEC